MNRFVLCLATILSAAPCLAETELPTTQEPKLYEQYLTLQQMQQRLSQRSLEDQTRLQPHMQRAERRACQRLRQDRQEQVHNDDYRPRVAINSLRLFNSSNGIARRFAKLAIVLYGPARLGLHQRWTQYYFRTLGRMVHAREAL